MNKVLLIILDGYGKAADSEGNAIAQANTPTLDQLEAEVPHCLLKADSEAVGLPANTMGGSEVGHYTIGAGRIVLQSLPYINKQITTGDFFENPVLLDAIKVVQTNNSTLHLVGMISDAGVHSHINHLFALLELAKQKQVAKVCIHAITDGRDVPERSASKYLEEIQTKIQQQGLAEVGDLIGRYYAMDRDQNWDRTEKAFKLYTEGNGETSSDPISALNNFYDNSKESDYYLPPQAVTNNQIKSNDAVIFFNYRTDRAKQLTDAFTQANFTHFKRNLDPLPHFVCFGEYSQIAPVAFPAPKTTDNLGKIVSDAGLKQLRIAETEKYPHVTFFFNSQNKEPNANEDRILVPSPKVASYAEQPEMSAKEITAKLLPELAQQKYEFIVLNFANLDLVGHSGKIEPTIKATEVVDECLSQILPAAKQNNYSVVITGDHGNAEEMLYTNGEACPSHSMNPTQCFVITNQFEHYQLNSQNQGLQDIAPTILQLLGLAQPTSMTGKSLISR